MNASTNSRPFNDALRFYLGGLAFAAPIALLVSKLFGTDAAFRIVGPLAVFVTCGYLSLEFLEDTIPRVALLYQVKAWVQRLVDVLFSAGLLILIGPALTFIALLVKVDSPGPILSRRHVVGKGGKIFIQYKFRSVRVDELIGREKDLGFAWKIANDPRLTRVGRLLRRSSLDETPQLINVLKGDMTFVGPRPLIAAALTPNRVVHPPRRKPGLTPTPITFPQAVILFLSGRARNWYTVDVEFEEYKNMILGNRTTKDIASVLAHQG